MKEKDIGSYRRRNEKDRKGKRGAARMISLSGPSPELDRLVMILIFVRGVNKTK